MATTKTKTCRCRPAKGHDDCFYCGNGWEPNLCGECAEMGIDGKTIAGTAAVTCSDCKRALLKRFVCISHTKNRITSKLVHLAGASQALRPLCGSQRYSMGAIRDVANVGRLCPTCCRIAAEIMRVNGR